MATLLNVIIPVMGLQKMNDGEVLDYCMQREQNLIDNGSSFGSLNPSVGTLTTRRQAFSNAVQNWSWGDKASTIKKSKERKKLEKTLWAVANDCVRIADGDQEIFALSGFGMKQKGTPQHLTETPVMKGLKDGVIPTTMYVDFKGVKNGRNYEIQVSEDADFDPDKIATVLLNSAGPVLINDLESGKRYWVRVRAQGARGEVSDWSTTANRICQ